MSLTMIHLMLFASLLRIATTRNFKQQAIATSRTIFKSDQVIFASNYNITSVLVVGKLIQNNDMPSIFFTVSDPNLIGGSCIYILEGMRVSALRVLEGGRDSTADYGKNQNVYFGAYNGIYKYDPETLSAKRYGIFDDDIIQLQKANATDTFYFLTSKRRVYKLERSGTVKTIISSIICAKEFVLDTSDNIYYVTCEDSALIIVSANDKILSLMFELRDIKDFKVIKLLRPAFVMENCIPFFGDGVLHILYANGTCINNQFRFEETPSAFSIDATLYLVAAVNGKMYEFNIMELIVKSMFGQLSGWPSDVSKMLVSMITSAKQSVYSYYL